MSAGIQTLRKAEESRSDHPREGKCTETAQVEEKRVYTLRRRNAKKRIPDYVIRFKIRRSWQLLPMVGKTIPHYCVLEKLAKEAGEETAQYCATQHLVLLPGHGLGPYEVLAPLEAGGMGEVERFWRRLPVPVGPGSRQAKSRAARGPVC